MNRHKEFPGFFFCGNCYFADSREQTKPNLPTNRKAKDGIFSCRAMHTMLDEPTYKKLSKNYHKKPISRKPPPLDDLSTCLPTSDTSFPGSNIETSPRDVADHDEPDEPNSPNDTRACTDKSTQLSLVQNALAAYTSSQGATTRSSSTPSNANEEIDNEEMSCLSTMNGELDEYCQNIQDSNIRTQEKEEVSPANTDQDMSNDTIAPHVAEQVHPSQPQAPMNIDQEMRTDANPEDSNIRNLSTEQLPPANTDPDIPNVITAPHVAEEPRPSQEYTPSTPTDQQMRIDNHQPTPSHVVNPIPLPQPTIATPGSELFCTRAELMNAKEELKVLKDQLRTVREENRSKQSTIRELGSKLAVFQQDYESASETDALIARIRNLINQRLKRLRSKKSRVAVDFFKKLATALLDPTIYHGLLRECAYDIFREYVRQEVFSPFEILKQMNLAGGGLNYSGIEILRKVEKAQTNKSRTLIPSSDCIQRAAKVVEAYGQQIVPYRMIRNADDGSEGFFFLPAKVMAQILRIANKLESEALLNSLKMAIGMDGALFTNNLTHCLGGLKFNDESNPNCQSRNWIFPILGVCCRETTKIIRGLFARLIRELYEAAESILPAELGIMAITLLLNCDMACEWKIFARGGAA